MSSMNCAKLRALAITGVLTLTFAIQAAELNYSQDFSKAALGEPPEDIMVLEGQITVREEAGNRFLELPGAPLETFGVVFGPAAASGAQAQARILATKAGRKQPVFALGLNGQGGYKVRVSPAKQAIELLKGAEGVDVLASIPWTWKSGEWTSLRLQVRPMGSGIVVEGKVWQGEQEPAAWMLKHSDATPVPSGRAGAWGLPFSGTPIRFDDFKVVPAQ